MRTMVVGDIHGCYQELLDLLDKAQLTEDDALISLGDIQVMTELGVIASSHSPW